MDAFVLAGSIRSQPGEIARLLGSQETQQAAADAAELFAAAGRVDIVGIGTSHNAALTAAYLLRSAGIDATAWSSYDYTLYGEGSAAAGGKPLLLLSHTGGKQFSRRAFGGPEGERTRPPTSVVVVTGEGDGKSKGEWGPELEAASEGSAIVLRTCEQEVSSMYTISHLTAMTAVAMIAERITPGCFSGALAALPAACAEAVALEPQVAALAKQWHANSAAGGEIVALGAGPHEPSAHEIEIKIGEAARVRCKGYAVEQYLHGRQIQIQSTDAFILFGGPGKALERTQAAARFIAAVQARAGAVAPAVVWVGPEGSAPEGTTHLQIPHVHEQLAVIVEAIPGQMLAGHLAGLEGVDGDSFRMDDDTEDARAFLQAHIEFIGKL